MEEKVQKTAEAHPERKISYEDLNNMAIQLSNQVRELSKRLQETNLTNFFKRLDYLFKVVENSDKFDVNFVWKCTSEIEESMTIPENKEGDSTESEDKTQE